MAWSKKPPKPSARLKTKLYGIVCLMYPVSGAHRFRVRVVKKLCAKDSDFYCIFEQIGYETEEEQQSSLGT